MRNSRELATVIFATGLIGCRGQCPPGHTFCFSPMGGGDTAGHSGRGSGGHVGDGGASGTRGAGNAGMAGTAGNAGAAARAGAIDMETIGPLGGVLRADGVTVTFPAQALALDTKLILTVGADARVTIMPDVYLAEAHPATVRMDPIRWPVVRARLAEHETAGEFYMIGPVVENADGSWQYDSNAFSSTRGLLVQTASADLYVEGDCSNSTVEETQTRQPAGIARSAVTRACLTDASAQVGNQHDPVTGQHAPQPDGDGERSSDEYNWMTREAASALSRTRAAVQAQLPLYDIWVNGAWDSSGGGTHSVNSNHYYGAAVDLALCKRPCADPRTKVIDPALLGQLPEFLLTSGFSWVWYEDEKHIHASISSPSLWSCGLLGTWVNSDQAFGFCNDGTLVVTDPSLTDIWCNGRYAADGSFSVNCDESSPGGSHTSSGTCGIVTQSVNCPYTSNTNGNSYMFVGTKSMTDVCVK